RRGASRRRTRRRGDPRPGRSRSRPRRPRPPASAGRSAAAGPRSTRGAGSAPRSSEAGDTSIAPGGGTPLSRVARARLLRASRSLLYDGVLVAGRLHDEIEDAVRRHDPLLCLAPSGEDVRVNGEERQTLGVGLREALPEEGLDAGGIEGGRAPRAIEAAERE